MSGLDLVSALMTQVDCSIPPGGNERSVRTIITKPMWDMFCVAVGIPKDSIPTPWVGTDDTKRVFGSETIVVESEQMKAVSFPIITR